MFSGRFYETFQTIFSREQFWMNDCFNLLSSFLVLNIPVVIAVKFLRKLVKNAHFKLKQLFLENKSNF